MVAGYNHQLALAQESCDDILRCIRFSNLHFTMQETPFSLYVTVRKKLLTDQIAPTENMFYSEMKEKYNILDQNNVQLRNLLEMKELENKNCDGLIQDLSQKLEKANLELHEAFARNNDTKKKLDDLTQTYAKVNDDYIRVKAENNSLQIELKEVKKVVKTKEKEEVRMTTKISNLEASVKNLKQENREAVNEKNKTSKEISKMENQILKLKERKASVSKSTATNSLAYCSEASTSTIGILESLQSSTSSTVSQTDHHPEIPYKIDTPLPPIFSSSLVYRSKSVFLTRSHPNLASIRWRDITEEELIEQEIDEIEMEIYDKEIRDFYEEAAEKSRNLRDIFEKQDIKKLFEEN